MKFSKNIFKALITLMFCFVPLTAAAQSTTMPSLLIREIKITGEELVVLQATEDISDLSEYWLGYTGSDSANPGSIVPSQQLPAKPLAAGQAVLLTSDGGNTCDAVFTTKLSPALSDTKGTVVVRQLHSVNSTSTFTTIDSVNWAKPSVSGTTSAQLDLRKETASLAYPVWYHSPNLTNPWRVGNLVACTLTLASQAGATQPEVITWQQTAIEPPAIIENVNEDNVTPVDEANPAANDGLAPLLITEVLPNPLGTGTDSTDEYVELYNSNDAPFALAGFTLQTGLTTKHNYVFPSGVQIPAKSFAVYYAAQTGLSMSNTSGQATLLDSNGVVMAQSDPYDTAPDGQAWALANGVWYWTTKPSPTATNVIAQPIALPARATKQLTVKTATTKAKSTTAKAAKAASSKKTTKTNTAASKAGATAGATPVAAATKIHPAVLASVACGALGYGAYVYRKDLANAFYKLRRH